MTESEFYSLSNSNLYEFTLYYGDNKVGILVNREKNYYVIPPYNIQKFNDGKIPLSELGDKVNLENILPNPKVFDITNQTRQATIYPVNRNKKIKKMVIFGAGASFDYTFDFKRTNRPPLAKDLFSDNYDEIIKKYPGAFNLSSNIALSNDIEDYFQKQWERILKTKDEILLSKLINTQYYLHELFQTISKEHNGNRKNNYSVLTKQAHEYSLDTQENILFVNFNYDTLIEEALEKTLHYTFNNLSEYIDTENKNILLFKPHGSCNWVKFFKQPFIQPNSVITNKLASISDMAKYFYESKFQYTEILKLLADDYSVRNGLPERKLVGVMDWNKLREFEYLPQLLIPYKEKDGFAMPDFHTDHLNIFMEGIEDIMIIGWKGTEIKFQELLANKLKGRRLNISIINNDDGTSIKELFANISSSIEYKIFRTFSIYMQHSSNGGSHFFD